MKTQSKDGNAKETIAIEIIYDRDHGKSNEGWYSRVQYSDGQEEDDSIIEDWSSNANASESTIRAWALEYFANPDGMTDDELAALRSIIEVRR
jgi:hypothetical protein